jgi:hypothetical protein
MSVIVQGIEPKKKLIAGVQIKNVMPLWTKQKFPIGLKNSTIFLIT